MRAVDATDVVNPDHGSWGKKEWKLLEADGAQPKSLTVFLQQLSARWRLASVLQAALSFARDRGVEVNVFHENVALSAYEHCEWELALHRLEWVQLRRILPSLVSYNTLIRVCATASWPAALQTLQVVQREQCLDTSTYHTAISASTRRWTLALEVLRGMHRVRVQCGLVTLTAAIKRSSQMKRWASAL
ncbi:unnamed protein product, partial [Symbiodinium necroappetens]